MITLGLVHIKYTGCTLHVAASSLNVSYGMNMRTQTVYMGNTILLITFDLLPGHLICSRQFCLLICSECRLCSLTFFAIVATPEWYSSSCSSCWRLPLSCRPKKVLPKNRVKWISLIWILGKLLHKCQILSSSLYSHLAFSFVQ